MFYWCLFVTTSDIPLKYRCPIKKSDHVRLTYLKWCAGNHWIGGWVPCNRCPPGQATENLVELAKSTPSPKGCTHCRAGASIAGPLFHLQAKKNGLCEKEDPVVNFSVFCATSSCPCRCIMFELILLPKDISLPGLLKCQREVLAKYAGMPKFCRWCPYFANSVLQELFQVKLWAMPWRGLAVIPVTWAIVQFTKVLSRFSTSVLVV